MKHWGEDTFKVGWNFGHFNENIICLVSVCLPGALDALSTAVRPPGKHLRAVFALWSSINRSAQSCLFQLKIISENQPPPVLSNALAALATFYLYIYLFLTRYRLLFIQREKRPTLHQIRASFLLVPKSKILFFVFPPLQGLWKLPPPQSTIPRSNAGPLRSSHHGLLAIRLSRNRTADTPLTAAAVRPKRSPLAPNIGLLLSSL